MLSRRKTILLFLILAVIAGAVVAWNFYKKSILRSEVAKTVAEKTNRLYTIGVGKLDMDEVAGFLAVSNLQLQPDAAIYEQMVAANDAPAILFRIDIPALTVTGVKTPKALLNKEIEGRKVLIENPRIELLMTGKGKDSTRNIPTKELYKQILGNLSLIAIDTVSVVNATLFTKDWKSGETRMQFDSVNIDLYKVAVDSLHEKDSTRILFAERANLHCAKISWSSKNKLYKYEIRHVDFNSGEKKLSIEKTSIDPTLPEVTFLKQFKTQVDRFDFTLQKIQLAGVNAAELLKETIVADSLVVGHSSFRIYRDLSYPRDKKNRVGTYPHQLLMKLPFDLQIRKALFTDAYIEYKEKNPKSEKSGEVQFHHVTVRMDNLTNEKQPLADNAVFKLQFNARFLNKVPIQALINFYPGHPQGKFTIDGELGSMDATAVNVLAKPMGLATIEKGTIRKLHFSFTGNDYRADGPVTLLYDDLKIALLKKDTADNSLDKKKLASFVANMKVKNANPGKDGEVRKTTVHYERDTNRSFFNLIWKSIFTGVKETVGIE